jgi:ABC-type multidrug transport system ATPase subunit
MLLEFDQVGRQFNGRWAIRDLSARVDGGTMVAILGANGAGKSTLLRLLAGWMPLSHGRIHLDGMPLRPTATRLRRRLMLLGDPPKSERAVRSKIGQLIKDYDAYRPGIEDEVADWFDALDITKVYHNSPANLSKGQSYKMAMVELFVVDPQVWLLDEPFSAGLDANGLQALESQMRRHVQSGGTVIFSSQWPEHARRLADRVLVLHDGNLVWDAAPTKPVPATMLQTVDDSLRAVLQGLGV